MRFWTGIRNGAVINLRMSVNLDLDSNSNLNPNLINLIKLNLN